MNQEIDNEFETIDSDDATKSKAANHPTLGDAPHVETDNEKAIRESAQFMADTMKGFTKMFCDDNGMLIDLTDKAGREYDRNFMLHVQARIDKALDRLGDNLTEHCKAEFLPEDKQTMESLNRNFSTTRYWVFGSCFIGALFTILGITLCIHSCGEQNVMEQQLKEQTEIANFGNFIKNRYPETYKDWKDATSEQKPKKSNRGSDNETTKSREYGQERN